MRLLAKLVLADVRRHPARMILTCAAMIAAACMVIWVVSGYDALMSQFGAFASKSFGRYELIVQTDLQGAPNPLLGQRAPAAAISAEAVEELRKDPAVAAADAILQARISVRRIDPATGMPVALPAAATRPAGGASPGGAPPVRPPGMMMGPTLVGTNAAQPPYPMVQGEWFDPSHPYAMQAVISQDAAQQLQVKCGDRVLAASRGGGSPCQVKIVGIVQQVAGPNTGGRAPMSSRGPAASALYMPVMLAEDIIGDHLISYVGLSLKPEVELDQFRVRWDKRLRELTPALVLQTPRDLKAELSEGMSAENVRKQAYSATGISLLAGLFIIFTTLSMGVGERVRQFAILRAVALTRAQVAMLIVGQSLLLAVIGWLGGLAAGWGLLMIMQQAKTGVLPDASLGVWCVALSGVCAIGGALAASIVPAWRATQISPLEAMAVRAPAARRRWLPLLSFAGFALLCVNPLLVYVVPVSDTSRYGIYMALGCTSMALGFVLLAPLAIVLTQGLLGGVLARVLGLHPSLLRTQLTSNLWRTVGTTVALTIGLGLFAAIQTWGYSMLRPFVPGDWVPQYMVAFLPASVPDSAADAVAHAPGVIPGQCLPLAVEQPQLADDITGSEKRVSVTRQDNVIMIGLDPQRGLGGDSPLLNLDFVQGSRQDAAAKLAGGGRYCVVPDHFTWETGLGVGGKFKLLPPANLDAPVEYTIAGVVSLPGWHWMTKFSGVRMNSGRSAAMVFAAYDDVHRDFALDGIRFFWLNAEKSTKATDLAASAQAIAQKATGRKYDIAAFGFPSMDTAPSVRVTGAEEIRSRIGTRADGMIWGMSQLPLVTLVVTSLGVVNAVMASVRARRWDMGVLRALGHTRFTLVRLVLAEAVMIGIVACVLSLGFGVMAGWCGAGISQYVSFFGGLRPGLVIPWDKLSLGFGATLALCLLAAIVPAVAVGRCQPLRLLQQGRQVM